MINFKCRKCGAEMETPASLAGKAERCPQCKVLNRVPWPPGTMSDPALMQAAEELAADFAEFTPDQHYRCWNCGKPIGFQRALAPDFYCPSCGMKTTLNGLLHVMRLRRDYRAAHREPDPTEEAEQVDAAKLAGRAIDDTPKRENRVRGINRVLFFDTETTGLPRGAEPGPHQPHVVQLAAVLADGQIEHTFATLIRPAGWRIEAGAFAVHGISLAQAKATGIPIAEAIQRFDALLQQADLVVAHNINFDRLMLDSEYLRLGLQAVWPLTFCTMVNCTDILRIPFYSGGHRYKWPTLGEAYYHFFGVPLVKAHDALADVMASQQIYYELINRGLVKQDLSMTPYNPGASLVKMGDPLDRSAPNGLVGPLADHPNGEDNDGPGDQVPTIRIIRTKVCGVSKKNEDGSRRQEIIAQCWFDEDLELVREPDNPHDENAIAVWRLSMEQCGYLSANLASKIAPLMDSGVNVTAGVLDVTGGDDGSRFGLIIQVEIHKG